MKGLKFYCKITSSTSLFTIALLSSPVAAQQASNAMPTAAPDKSGIAVASQQAAVSSAAPSASTSSQTALGDIIVTAQKRQSRVNDVPMSITAATGETIAKRGITSVEGLSRIVPGFQAAPSGFGQTVYFLRGIGFFDTSLQSKPAVTVYTDEQPYPLPALSAGAAFDNERVEVLKGPQGTLFGSNSTGGAVNFIANKPTNHFAAGFDGSYGRFNDVDVSGFVSGPIAETVNARIALRRETADPWQNPYFGAGPKNGRKSFFQGRAIVDWQPTDRLKIEVNTNGFLDKGGNQAPQFLKLFPQTATAVLNPGLLTFPAGPHNDRAADGGNIVPLSKDNYLIQGNVRVDYKLSDDVKLTSLTSYDHFSEDYGVDVDGTPYADQDYRVTGFVHSFNQELRLTGDYHNWLHWIVGANYETDKISERQAGLLYDSSSGHTFDRLGYAPIYDEIDVAHDRFKSAAVFSNVDIDLNRHFTLHAGVRYTHTTNDFSGCLISSNTTLGYGLSVVHHYTPLLQPGQCIEFTSSDQYVGLVQNKLTEHNVPWRVGIDWKPEPGALVYANISCGFKSGGFPNLGATNVVQYTPVKQEEVTAYEIGFKKTLLDHRLQLNGALFYDDYKNKQLKGKIRDVIFGALNAIINVPKSYVEGAEVQLAWRLTPQLTITGGGTYLKTKVQGDFFNYTYSGALLNFKDATFPYTSRWQSNVDVEYTIPLSDRLNAYIGGDATYRSRTNSEFIKDPIMDIDPYTLFDIRAGVTTVDGRWRVQLSGYNVTNKYYWTQVGRISDSIARLTGMPATYSISVSYRF